MTSERLKIILQNYISNDLEAADPAYVKEVLRDECGCTDAEIEEILYDKPPVMQYSIDVEDTDEDMETKIKEALEKAGVNVLGICWKARWMGSDYEKGFPPIDWD